MSIPLPSLQIVEPVPAIAHAVASPSAVIILHTIDVPPEVKSLLTGYGKVVEYDSTVEGGLPIDKLVFDYLCLDIRKKADRAYFDSQNTNPFSVICYISPIEQFDSLIEDLGCDSVITTFPPRQHFQADFNKLLLGSSTGSPSKCLSLLTFASNFFLSLKRKSLNSTP
jgi:hypothetical protein